MDESAIAVYFGARKALEKAELELDKTLCDMAARAFTDGEVYVFNRCAAVLNARYDELKKLSGDRAAPVEEYIGEKLREGLKEYEGAQFAFSGRDIKEVLLDTK
ncbi:MAG: hypothetical protein NC299_07790 [Lachnospiraceae bacterium]|nr:hypothetical protein [Ruminococcus sp.]MCM1275256.1 hypothetical protein [Lachnospiraceae bacterium]